MQIEKGVSDPLQYDALVLPNGMRVVLVHDEHSQTCAAAVKVDVGSLQEPATHPGLAHFLEHMLFMGSQSHPSQSDFDRMVSSAGGSSNAYTDFECTVFYFSVARPHFASTLDCFAQFFVAPLLSRDCVDKEVRAVDAEFNTYVSQDNWREAQLVQHLARPDSRVRDFNFVGNAATLSRPDVYEQLRAFYAREYSANRMTAVLVGSQPLAELRQLAAQHFSAVVDRALPQLAYAADGPYYAAAQQGKLVRMHTISATPSLVFYFFVADIFRHWPDRPEAVVVSLLGEEHAGSLLAALLAEGLAHELVAGHEHLADVHANITVRISLTACGFARFERVVELLAQYIAFLRATPLPPALFEEMRATMQLAVDYPKQGRPEDTCLAVLSCPRRLPLAKCLRWNATVGAFRPELYQQLWDGLHLDAAIVVLCSDTFRDEPHTEPVFGTRHSVRDFSPAEKESFRHAAFAPGQSCPFFLPGQNKMMPRHFGLLQEPDMPVPAPLPADAALGVAFFKRQTGHRQPKVVLTYAFLHDFAAVGLQPDLLLSLRVWELWFRQFARFELYEAHKVGNKLKIDVGASGIRLTLRGFSDSIGEFARVVARRVGEFAEWVGRSGDAGRAQFALRKEELDSWFDELLSGDIAAFAQADLPSVITSTALPLQDLCDALPDLSFDRYAALHRLFFAAFYYKALIVGNISEAHAREVNDAFTSALRRPNAARVDLANTLEARVMRVGAHDRVALMQAVPKAEERNSYMYMLFLGARSVREAVLFRLLENLLYPTYFERMRTERQLGYLAGCATFEWQRVNGLAFFVSSDKQSPAVCAAETLAFLREQLAHLDSLPPAAFEVLRSGVVAQLRQKWRNLKEESLSLMAEVASGQLDFEWKQRLAGVAADVTLPQLVAFANSLLAPQAARVEIHYVEEAQWDEARKGLQEQRDKGQLTGVFEEAEDLHAAVEFYAPIRLCDKID